MHGQRWEWNTPPLSKRTHTWKPPTNTSMALSVSSAPVPTPAEIRAMLARLDRAAKEAEAAGEWKSAVELTEHAVKLEAALAELERLTGRRQPRTVNSEHVAMTDEHRAALSESRKPADRFLKHIRLEENGRWSLNRLAAGVAMSPAALSQARLPKSHENSRPIAESKAKQIEALTKWPADERHWPGGIRKD